MARHTAGTWAIMRDGPIGDGKPWAAAFEAAAGLTVGSTDHTEPIGRVWGYLQPVEANAALICAAPDLMEACKFARRTYHSLCACQSPISGLEHLVEAVEKMDAAIQKAQSP